MTIGTTTFLNLLDEMKKAGEESYYNLFREHTVGEGDSGSGAADAHYEFNDLLVFLRRCASNPDHAFGALAFIEMASRKLGPDLGIDRLLEAYGLSGEETDHEGRDVYFWMEEAHRRKDECERLKLELAKANAEKSELRKELDALSWLPF